MDRMRTTLAALAFAACAGLGLAATPSKQQALDAISVLEKNLTGPQATQAAKTVVVYAQLSDDVMVDIGPEQLPWATEEWGLDKDRELSLHSLLVAAFVAGDVKTQLKNEKAEDDTYSGWLFALAAYHRLKASEDFRSPSLEALSKMQAEGKLRQHAKDVHAEDQQDSADTEQKPLA
jgi:hypothetical protein